MADYQIGFHASPFNRSMTASITSELDRLLPRANWFSDTWNAWKGTEAGEDHDCSIFRGDDIRFEFRIDMRNRAKAEHFLRRMCSLCSTYGLTLVPSGSRSETKEPDFESVLSYLESTTRVRLLAMTGRIAHEFAAPVEFVDRDHDEFQTDLDGLWFDPVGAASISIRFAPAEQGYNLWWRFQASESDTDRLVQQFLPPSSSTVVWGSRHIRDSLYELSPAWWVPAEQGPLKASRFLYDPDGVTNRQGYWQVQYEFESRRFFCQLSSGNVRG